jgi:hypothetical protein
MNPLKSACVVSIGLLSALGGNTIGLSSEPVRLFNGKDLAGWSGDPAVWSVEDGVITGRTTDQVTLQDNTFLIWEGGMLDDFQLTLEFRILGGNSGIQYRSQVMDKEKWRVGGYQADIDSANQYSGILYDELGRGILAQRGQRVLIAEDGERLVTLFGTGDELKNAIHNQQWNRYKIIARGPVLQHMINDQLMSETADEQLDARETSGVLALQVHAGPPMAVQFRNLELNRLDTEKEEAAKD